MLKNTDSLQKFIDILIEREYCQSGIDYVSSFSGTIEDFSTKMEEDDYDKKLELYIDALTNLFDVLPSKSRKIYFNFLVNHERNFDVILLKVYRKNYENMTKSEVIMYKKYLKDKLPKMQKEGEF